MVVTKQQLTTLIREAVNTVLREAKFNPDRLDQQSFAGFPERVQFVNQAGLVKLGEGETRAVYLLDSKRALKVATNQNGISQNQTEIAMSGNSLVARVFKSGKGSTWIVSELVRPISSKEEFKKLTGVSWGMFAVLVGMPTTLQPQVLKGLQKASPTDVKFYASSPEEYQSMLQSPFLLGALGNLKGLSTKLNPGDLSRMEHWGKTPDQRVVLLDYGYTQEVSDNHYTW